MPNRDGSLKAREFVFFCEDYVLSHLPPGMPEPERRVMWTILQFHFGDPDVHFELQPQMGRGVVEMGLHFEGTPVANEAWVEAIGARAGHLLAELGPAWELEEWTASWRRLHRPYRFEKLTGALGREVGDELLKGMAVLAPVVRACAPEIAALPGAVKEAPTRAGKPGGRQRWHARARR